MKTCLNGKNEAFQISTAANNKKKTEEKKERKENTNKYSKLALKGARAGETGKQISVLVKEINTLSIFYKDFKLYNNTIQTLLKTRQLFCHVASSPRSTTSTASSVQCTPCPVHSAHTPTLPVGVHHFDDVVGSSSLLCTDIHCWGWGCPLTFVEASVEHISKGLSALLNIDTTRYYAWCGWCIPCI